MTSKSSPQQWRTVPALVPPNEVDRGTFTVTQGLEEKVALRTVQPDDVDLIYDSWLHSGRTDRGPPVDKAIYFHGQRQVIGELLKRSPVIIACEPAVPAHVLGWVCFELRAGLLVLHYIYVKKAFRRMGIATLMMRDMLAHPDASKGLTYSHWTPAAKPLMKRFHGVYNPYLSR